MVHINFTEHALSDLDQIAEFISRDAPNFAAIFIAKIFEKVTLLRNNPRLGRKVPEFNNDAIREMLYGHYRIVYKILDKSSIDIISVHHGAQRLSEESLFE